MKGERICTNRPKRRRKMERRGIELTQGEQEEKRDKIEWVNRREVRNGFI